jgi:hypothetical protein
MARAKGKKLSQMIDNTVVYGDKFGDIGGSAGDRIKRGGSGVKIAEDDPRWNPRTMGNRRRRVKGFTRGPGQ